MVQRWAAGTWGLVLLLSLSIGGAVVLVAPDTAAAQSNKRAEAEATLRKGLAAQKSRKHDAAISLFSNAISSGALARKQMTYALYRRAKSYRNSKRPAQAIADLNSALFFKGDLSSKDRVAAIEERARAFKDAGVAATPVAGASEGAQWSPNTTAAAAVAPSRIVTQAPRRVVERQTPVQSRSNLPPTTPILGSEPVKAARRDTSVTSAPSRPVSLPAFSTKVRPNTSATSKPARQARAPKQSASAPRQSAARVTATSSSAPRYGAPSVERGSGVARRTAKASQATPRATPLRPAQPWAQATETTRYQPPATARTPASVVPPATVAEAASTPKPTPSQPAPSAIGQFFSSVFGGGENSSVASGQTNAIVTGSVRPRPAPPAKATAAAPRAPAPRATAALRPSATATPPRVVPPAEPAPIATRQTAASPVRSVSGYEIEVAVMRNRFRADALARQLDVQYGSNFWNKQTARVVEKSGASDDDEGRYAVRFGAYAARTETADMCATFKANGLGCDVMRK